MKKIGLKSIFLFLILISLSFFSSIGISSLFTHQFSGFFSRHDFLFFLFALLLFFIISVIEFRLWIKFFPTPIGQVTDSDLWYVHVYQLFYLVIFNSVIRNGITPIPILRIFYQLLGAKIDDNSYVSGIMYDCHLISIGKNCILGEASLVTPHQVEGITLGFYPITISNNVTVGAHAVLLPGVTIEDHGNVASGAVVVKHTTIKQNEAWGGVPAKKLK